MGVDHKMVRARRVEMVERREFPDLPEKTLGRDGNEYVYAERKKPEKKSESKSADKPQSQDESQDEKPQDEKPTTVGGSVKAAKEHGEENGSMPEDAPGWPTHPSQQQESEAAKRIRQITAWMAGLSEFDPVEAANLLSARADVEASLL